MCESYFQNRRSWSSDGGSKVPIFSSKPTSTTSSCSSCRCSLAHQPSELRFSRGESVRRRAGWIEKATKIIKERYDVLPNSWSERQKISKPNKDDEDPAPGGGSSGG